MSINKSLFYLAAVRNADPFLSVRCKASIRHALQHRAEGRVRKTLGKTGVRKTNDAGMRKGKPSSTRGGWKAQLRRKEIK